MKLSKEISGWLVLLLVALASCHTEKATQRTVAKAIANQDAFAQLGNYWQILHPCINDTTTKEITRYVQGATKTVHDTTVVNGITYIRDSTFIHDTLYKDKIHTVIDRRALQQANDSIAKYKAKTAQMWADSITNEQLHQAALKAEKKKTSKANWRFVWACLIGGVLVFRKPLLSFLTGGWSKILKLFVK